MFYSPPCQRRSPIVNAVLSGALVITLLAMLGGFVNGGQTDRERAAIVYVGLASGVCVSPDGVILTAAHCVYAPPQPGWQPFPQRQAYLETIPVKFADGREFPARVVKVVDVQAGSDIALLKANGRGLPCVPIAARSPAAGEQVYSIAYPNGHFARMESEVVGVGREKSGLQAIKTSHRANPGASGGALMNQRGELVGICSRGSVDVLTAAGIEHTDQYTLWATTESIQATVKGAGFEVNVNRDEFEQLRILHVWSTPNCAGCITFKTDKASGKIKVDGISLDECYNIVLHNAQADPEGATKAGVSTVPTFITDDGAKLVGYPGPEALGRFLSTYQRVGAAVEASAEAAPGPPAAEPVVLPTAPDQNTDTQGDGSGLRVIVLVRKQQLSTWKAAAAYYLEQQAEGIVKRKLKEVLGTRAEIDIVFERVSPTRFTALAGYMGLKEDKVAGVVVAVKKIDKPPAEGLLKRLEMKLDEVSREWGRAGFDIVFERTDPAAYDELLEAAAKIENSEPSANPLEGGWLNWLIGSIVALFGGMYTGTRRFAWSK